MALNGCICKNGDDLMTSNQISNLFVLDNVRFWPNVRPLCLPSRNQKVVKRALIQKTGLVFELRPKRSLVNWLVREFKKDNHKNLFCELNPAFEPSKNRFLNQSALCNFLISIWAVVTNWWLNQNSTIKLRNCSSQWLPVTHCVNLWMWSFRIWM